MAGRRRRGKKGKKKAHGRPPAAGGGDGSSGGGAGGGGGRDDVTHAAADGEAVPLEETHHPTYEGDDGAEGGVEDAAAGSECGAVVEIGPFVAWDGAAELHPLRQQPGLFVRFEQYRSEESLPGIMNFMMELLSEPYSVFTYRYFVNAWPDLCYMVMLHDPDNPTEERMIGAVVGKMDHHQCPRQNKRVRGYIGMLGVLERYRGNGLGRKLVCIVIDTMEKKRCQEVVLEAETTNESALRLYEGLGFLRDKRLPRYYMSGKDAYRLKLYITPP